MFQKFKSIDAAFRQVRMFTLTVLIVYTLLIAFVLYRSYKLVSGMQEKIYILHDGKVLEAVAMDHRDNIPVEAKDHVAVFHQLFFSLDPDEKLIREHIAKALYLADGSARRIYENLKEAGYFSNIVAGNISQEIRVDSIDLDMHAYPYGFRCYGTERIIRATSITTRSLVTRGWLRNIARTTNNSHGFLIERWEIVENKDLNTLNR